MKRFKIEQSEADIISHAGLALISQAISRYTDLSREIDAQVPLRHGIPHSAIVKSYLVPVQKRRFWGDGRVSDGTTVPTRRGSSVITRWIQPN